MIDKDPVLSKAFKDPHLFKVLEEFHKNPKQALAAAQHNPEVKEFLQHFCSIMGDHFTSIAGTQDRERKPLISEQPSEGNMFSKVKQNDKYLSTSLCVTVGPLRRGHFVTFCVISVQLST